MATFYLNHSKPKARQAALRRLDRRECSSVGMARALKRKGFSADIISWTIQELLEEKLIDDQKYSEILVREQILKGKGPRWIQMKLKVEGILADQKYVEELIASTTHTSELEVAKAVVMKRYPNAQVDPVTAAKAIQALLRRGFSYDVARQVVLAPSSD